LTEDEIEGILQRKGAEEIDRFGTTDTDTTDTIGVTKDEARAIIRGE
jgi:hypothetical protein